jgi:hypothetical protein
MSIAAQPSCLYVLFFKNLGSLLDCLDNWRMIHGFQCSTLGGCAGIKMMPITIVTRCFTSYKYSYSTPLRIQHFSSFSSRVYSLPLHLCTMEEKRGIKHSRSSASGSSFSSSGASTPTSSLSNSMPPPVSPPEASSRRPPSPVHEHSGPFVAIPVVDLSSDEEEIFLDTTWDKEFARRVFNELNHELFGPPGDGNIITLSDSDEEEEVCEEITVDVEAASPSTVNSSAPSVFAAIDDDAPDGV